jgi:hypothetical protein
LNSLPIGFKWLGRFLGLLLGLGLFALSVYASPEAIIRRYSIDLDVNVNGLITVQHELETEFFVESRGIFAYIPQSYAMVWDIDGVMTQKNYFFPVRNVRVVAEPFQVDTDAFDNILIRIGDPNIFFAGTRTYRYSYTLQLRDLGLNGRQAFYLNLIGDGWSLPIESVDFSITFPKEWPNQPIFYRGGFGDDTPYPLDTVLTGRTLSGRISEPFAPNEALTIFTELPNDFFTFVVPFNGSWLILGASALMSVGIFVLFKRYGEDEKFVDTVEFNPIKGLSSAQVGYIFDGSVEVKDVLSLIIEWAYQGHLQIVENQKSGFTLIKLSELPDQAIRAEKILFEQLFKDRTEVREKDLKNRFYQAIQHAQQGIQSHFASHATRRIYSRTASVLKAILGLVHLLPFAALIAHMNHRISYRIDVSLVYAALFYGVGSALSLALILLIKRWPSLRWWLRSLSIAGLGFVSALFLLLYYVLSVTIELSFLQFLISVLLMSVNLGFISVMDKRTTLGTSYYGRILGLKRFIESAEKERLETLVQDDPSYFYKILPYAYVLNVSDIWSRQFESIAMEAPNWYVSNRPFTTLLFMRSMNRTLGRLQSAMTSMPQQAGRGGGGFSGGSGGGFSGGGFGGGGGGRW